MAVALPVLAGCGAGDDAAGLPGARTAGTHARSADASLHRASPVSRRSVRAPERPPGPPEGDGGGRLGAEDGELPGGATAFDDHPGVTDLDPALLRALQDASRDAEADGVELYVSSGWRSAAYQEKLLDDAVAQYGSRAEAARWVSTPATSAHVSGHAVDVGQADAAAWLDSHGARFGLCRVYDNEPWHYELRPEAVRAGCPSRYADPTQDPRTQR